MSSSTLKPDCWFAMQINSLVSTCLRTWCIKGISIGRVWDKQYAFLWFNHLLNLASYYRKSVKLAHTTQTNMMMNVSANIRAALLQRCYTFVFAAGEFKVWKCPVVFPAGKYMLKVSKITKRRLMLLFWPSMVICRLSLCLCFYHHCQLVQLPLTQFYQQKVLETWFYYFLANLGIVK